LAQGCIQRAQGKVIAHNSALACTAQFDSLSPAMQPAGFSLSEPPLLQDAKATGSMWHARRRPPSAPTDDPSNPQSELTKREEKHELAMKCANAGDYARAWELLEEVGDREGARRMLQDAYKAGKSQAVVQSALEEPVGTAEVQSVAKPPLLPTLLPGGGAGLAKQQNLSGTRRPARMPPPSEDEAAQGSVGSTQAPAEAVACAEGLQDLGDFTAGLRRTLGINKRRLSRIGEVFEQWDRDGSGAVSREEFLVALQQLRSYVTAEEASALFTMADKDGDGYLVREEFERWLGAH